MRHPIQLDCDIALEAEKVDDIATNAALSAELLAQQLAALKMLSQLMFRRGGIVSEFAPSLFQRRRVSQASVSFRHSGG